jgi:hypothetical protein
MSTIFRRDHTDVEREAIRRRRALDNAISELRGAANALQAARAGDNSLRDAVLDDARRRLESTQILLRAFSSASLRR